MDFMAVLEARATAGDSRVEESGGFFEQEAR